MARKVLIEIRKGTESSLTAGTLVDGELGYTTDTKKLFIGYGGQNICIGAASSLGDMLKSVYDTDNDGIVDKAEDSNTLGGKLPSAFAPSGFGLGVGLSTVTISDSNNATTTGMYYASSSDTNKPSGVTDGALFVLSYSSVWVNQLYLDWRTNKIYRRMCNNGTWSSWIELLTTKRANTWNDLKGV